MNRQLGKRDTEVVAAAKKNRAASFGDRDGEGDENAQFCNRIGCRGRIKYTENTKFRSTYATRKSSGSDCVIANTGKLPPELKGKLPNDSKRKLHSQLKYVGAKSRLSSNVQLPSSSRRLTESNSESLEESRKANVLERRIYIASSNFTSGRTFYSNTSSRNTSSPSSSRCSALQPSNSSGGGSCDQIGKRTSSAARSLSGTGIKANSALYINMASSSTMSISSASRVRSQMTSRGSDGNSSSAGKSHVPDNGGSIRLSNSLSSCSAGFTPSGRELLHNYDTNGAAEILLALERIEQDQDRTHEQVLLEMSLFLSGLAPYDQHRHMRLDIDDMSYEELLALGERMGTVNTPLSEEELSRCLKRSVYLETSTATQTPRSNHDLDDTKCSICQEEYVTGDLIGTLLECCHGYHETCVIQWLRLKNWCPVCKASAASSSSS